MFKESLIPVTGWGGSMRIGSSVMSSHSDGTETVLNSDKLLKIFSLSQLFQKFSKINEKSSLGLPSWDAM
jgi:hypothetical protein